MATPVNSSNQNIDFTRLLLLDNVTKPQAAIALFPENATGTTLSVNVSSTSISIKYISTSVVTSTFSYVGKSIKDLCLEINLDTIPILATPCLRDSVLSSGDIYLPDTTSYFSIPSQFPASERTINNGIIIRSKKFTVRHNQDSNFKLFSPYSNSLLLPWYPVISNSSFTAFKNGKSFRYNIPEYHNQVWSLKYGKPFKDVIGEKLTFVKNNVYKVSRTPIFWNGENVKLYNNDSLISPSVIEDIDITNGIIYFTNSFSINEDTSIDYTHIENNYEYRHLNVNCHLSQNPSLLNKFILFYAIPFEGINYTVNKRTIFHSIGDSVDEAISNIIQSNNEYDPIVIGAYGCHQVIPSNSINILDTRVLGGGLIEDTGPKSPVHEVSNILDLDNKNTKIEDIYKESKFFFDIGTYDGEKYPGAGSVVVEIPSNIRDRFNELDIRAGVSKFLGAGIYPEISYYDNTISTVTGVSSQISFILNGGMQENTYLYSGACWNKYPIKLNHHVSTGFYTLSGEPITNNILRVDGTGVIRTNSSAGTRQSYLKSSPIAEISYYTRNLLLDNTHPADGYSYTEWNKVTTFDTRDVPSGQLTKGFVYFGTTPGVKEYSRVNVNSPYRLDSTGVLRSNLANDISLISNNITGLAKKINFSVTINGQQESISPLHITSVYNSLASLEKVQIGDYYGVSNIYRYLFDLCNSDLYNSYSGLLEPLGKSITQSFPGLTSGHLKYFDIYAESYNSNSSTLSGVDIGSFFDDISKYGHHRKSMYGTGDYVYSHICNNILPILSGHLTLLEDNYLPYSYNYNYNPELDTVTIEGIKPFVPEFSGFSEAEIVESNNNDFEYLELAQDIGSISKLIYNFSGAFCSGIRSPMLTLWSGVSTCVNRANLAINSSRTNNGNAVAQHWYNPYNRYGRYAGSISQQIIKCISSLYTAQTGGIGLTYDNQPGVDVSSLRVGLSYLDSILKYASSGFTETITNGGLLDRYTPDLLASYGWYVNNYQNYVNFISGYNSSASINNNVNYFSGIFHTGLLTTIKGMVTTNGDILETTIVDGDVGPFQVYVPTLIFKPLTEACIMDSNKYLPVTEAVYNTVKNNYSVNGFYYSDPLKSIDVGTYEHQILPYYVRLYNSL